MNENDPEETTSSESENDSAEDRSSSDAEDESSSETENPVTVSNIEAHQVTLPIKLDIISLPSNESTPNVQKENSDDSKSFPEIKGRTSVISDEMVLSSQTSTQEDFLVNHSNPEKYESSLSTSQDELNKISFEEEQAAIVKINPTGVGKKEKFGNRLKETRSEEEDDNTNPVYISASQTVNFQTRNSSLSTEESDDEPQQPKETPKDRSDSEASASSLSSDENQSPTKITSNQSLKNAQTELIDSNSSDNGEETEDNASAETPINNIKKSVSTSDDDEENSSPSKSDSEGASDSCEEISIAINKMPVRDRLSSSSLEPLQAQTTGSKMHHRATKQKAPKHRNSSSAEEDKSSSSDSNDSSSSSSGSSNSDQDDDDDDDNSSLNSSSSSSSGHQKKKSLKDKCFGVVQGTLKRSKRCYKQSLEPLVSRLNKFMNSSRFAPQFEKAKASLYSGLGIIREDISEIRRFRRTLASRPRSEWSSKLFPTKTRFALSRVIFLVIIFFLMIFLLLSSSSNFSLRSSIRRKSTLDYPPAWKKTKSISYKELLDLINVYDNSIRNDSSVKIKKMPSLEKPVYLTMSSKDLIQIKRPAVRKKRPDEPRAVRTFGCLRDGCRGLEIEDLLDRGWQMRFRAAQKNDSYKNINYRVTFLLTDTTQLNHMRAVRPDLYETIYNTYEKKCYLIAFDGADAIGGNKGQQLKVKERFVRKYGCKFSELAISPASYRLYLEDECQDLISFGSSEVTWLLKPETGSQGQGITFHTEISDIIQKQPKFFPCAAREWKPTERYLVQEYIEKPLLLKKSKFDCRVYMNIASSNPFLVFYHEGYLRRALAAYAPLSRDRRVYLTNTHFQSMKKDFKLSEHIWSFQEFQAYLKEQGRTGAHYIESILNPQIKKVALFIFHSARQKLKKRKGTFHIMGLDFMIDEDFHVWFIEANGYPGFTWSINFDTRTMVEEWFNLAQQVHENPRFYMLMREGDRYGGFEMIFSELEEERMQILYNPCQEFKYNRGYTAPLKEANKLFAQISGKGGKTERFKRFSNTVRGTQFYGGNRAEQLKRREEYFQKFGCRANSVHFSPPQYALYDSESCNNFFTENAVSPNAWVVKPVVSPGNAEEFRVFSSIEAMKEEYSSCTSRVPDFVAQQLIPERPLTLYKWWDIRVYMLIASTKPYFVFYHHGFARTSKLSYVPGGEAKPIGENSGSSINPGSDKDEEDEGVDIEEDDGGDDEDEPTKKAADSPRKGEDNNDMASETTANSVPVAGTDPLFANQPPSEPWAPLKITTGARWTLGEEFITLETLEDEMARADLVGSRWLSSVFDTYAKRIAHFLFQSARDSLERGNETYQITALNFLLDHKLQIHFIDSNNVDADSIPNVDALQEHKANFLETLAGLVLEIHTLPSAFARLRRGDSYGQWRLVFSEIEEKQRSMTYDPCDEFKRNLQVHKSSLYKDAWLHQHSLKSHARNKRELRKYVDRKWESTCKSRPTAELRASCIRNTISYRYKKYIEKERVPYQEGYVENYIRELQNRPNTPGKGGASQGGGL